MNSPLGSIEKIEADLWEAADQLRANSKLTSSEYCMPVLGVIFLRHATTRRELPFLDVRILRLVLVGVTIAMITAPSSVNGSA